ncbi:CoA pyrophosphatase [Nocardioides sp.]|uniref:NUDIX hydrolase n=1 Tax=Nocardioides sp. TaxID=35761 RepID=UPI002723C588|nr:CoA pyrophosphatase [Nocardioides sp.]MDO9455559.1 CoA pyrophosphatase [Nocardioides sp.]
MTWEEHPGLPDWLRPVEAAARSITVHDLTRFMVPDDADDVRRSAVLMLFGEGPSGPDLLLTERAHHMRSHPGQVSFPGGSVDPGETPQQTALREAEEETGLDPAGVEVFAELPELWLPPSNFAVVPVLAWWRDPSPVSVRSPDEVHAVWQVPISELRDPAHRITVTGPRGWRSPGFLIGDDHDVILWGFTGGIVARLFEFLGWIDDLPDAPERELPAYMLGGRPPANVDVLPNTDFEERRRG